MKIPYGRSNFADIRRGGFFYVDKTPFLPVLERGESGYAYLLFLRPRRIGKSLLLSMMEHYYDIGREKQFDELFGGLWVHQHPTPERNRYLVLTLDFSIVSTDGPEDALRYGFLEAVKSCIRTFLMRYRERIPELARFHDRLEGYQDATALMASLLSVIAGTDHKLYLLIDEYDNFANRILSDGAHGLYESIVQRTGFVRSFYASLKTGTQNGAIARIFITGVSPILLDDLSSGFNIVRHVSQSPWLNTLAGFTRPDVERAVDEFLSARPHLAEQPEIADRARLLDVMERHYNGYRFSEDAGERVFNSDMVLYFLSELDDRGRYPADMLDLNVRTDYRRLVRIGMLSSAAAAARRALLESILGDGYVNGALVKQFGAGSLSSENQLISLLYYLGMLTLAAEAPGTGSSRLEIPNRVIRELQWEHLATLLKEQEHVELDTRHLEIALGAMAMQGDIAPFLELFHGRVIKALGIKDLRQFSEKSIKLMLMTYISLSRVYHPLSEKELAQGYCDLFLAVSQQAPAARFAWLLEIKYLPTGAKAGRIEAAFREAALQVARYASDAALVPLLTGGKELRAGSLVFVGAKKVLFRSWPHEPHVKPPAAKPKSRSRPKKGAARSREAQ
jgi:Predicted AAA-ATPase/PD-(D/E)XK nuclease superfamily